MKKKNRRENINHYKILIARSAEAVKFMKDEVNKRDKIISEWSKASPVPEEIQEMIEALTEKNDIQ